MYSTGHLSRLRSEGPEASGMPRSLSTTGTTTMPAKATSMSAIAPRVKSSDCSVSLTKLRFSRSL